MTIVPERTGRRSLVRVLIALLAAIALWSILPAAAQAAFPGTNGKLAFGSARNGFPADNDVFTMASDGTAETRITSLNQDELHPAWSANGAKIAFERNTGLRSDIWVANANGSSPVQLTTNAATDSRPSWARNGNKIVFSSDRDGTPGVLDLFVMDSNGANQVNITNTPTIDEDYPSWSSDGTAIAFSRDGDIYKSTPTGSNLKRLTTAAVTEIEPDWSPGNNQIVYRTGLNADDNIWKMNADGTGQAPLVNNGGVVEERPVWSPQGDKIAFVRGAFTNAEIYTMNPDGTGVVRVTNNTTMDVDPSWQAIPAAPSYVRPKLASKVRTSLVPSFRPCKVPDRVHGPPLGGSSCTPPKLYSRHLTVGTPEANGKTANFTGFVKLTGIPGNPATPTVDEADVKIVVKINDVRNKSDLSDYTGQLRVRADYRRLTDKENAVGTGSPIDAATSTDTPWLFSMQCTATADTNIGSSCNLTTTRDAITPGSFKEGKRSVLEMGRLQVWDGGNDGLNSTAVNDLFLTQGLFVP